MSRFRYFDPENRRAGLPADVGALVEKMAADSATLTLVNTNPVEARIVIVQGGRLWRASVGVGEDWIYRDADRSALRNCSARARRRVKHRVPHGSIQEPADGRFSLGSRLVPR